MRRNRKSQFLCVLTVIGVWLPLGFLLLAPSERQRSQCRRDRTACHSDRYFGMGRRRPAMLRFWLAGMGRLDHSDSLYWCWFRTELSDAPIRTTNPRRQISVADEWAKEWPSSRDPWAG